MYRIIAKPIVLITLLIANSIIAFQASRSNHFRLSVSSICAEESSICVIGGGFGGLYTALKLEKLLQSPSDITVIDAKDKFVFLPLLYELAVGDASVAEVAPRYTDLLSTSNIKFVQGNVGKIDTNSREIEYIARDNTCSSLKFKYLVVAPGIQPRRNIIPGAFENAMTFYQVDDAYKLQMKLRALTSSDRDKIRVVVIGGGYSGVEVALNVAKYLGPELGIVSIIDRNDRIMHSSPTHNMQCAERALKEKNVSVYCHFQVESVSETEVTIFKKDDMNDRLHLNADLVIVTAGTEPCKLVSTSEGFKKDQSGRVVVNRSLQTNVEDIFALGDCASIEGMPLPSTAQVAMQQADIVAQNIAILINDESSTAESLEDDSSSIHRRKPMLEKFIFVPLGEMLTLGTQDAAVTSLGGLVTLDGPFAAVARRFVYGVRMPTQEQRINALVNAGISTLGNIAASLLKKN